MPDIEIWKPIKGYEEEYEVSSWGNVRSCDRKVNLRKTHTRTVKGQMMQIQYTGKGYPSVLLSKNNKSITHKISRLVGLHFVDNPENKPLTSNIDGDRSNCHYTNIKWCTHKESFQDARDRGTMNNNRKVHCPQLDRTFNSVKEAGETLGIDRGNISACVLGKRKIAGRHPENKDIKLTWQRVN